MLDLGMDFGVANSVVEQKATVIEKPTVESILECIDSAISLDIAKNHTGITIKENGKIRHDGFTLETEYRQDDPFSEIRMRKEFASKLKPFIEGKHFQVGAVEDVFGGVNYQTTRKLLALNTVLDEFIYDGVCSVDDFYKWENKLWKKYFRKIVKIKGYPDDKEEIRQIFEYLDYGFYNEHKNDRGFVCFQDILDSLGLLCGVAIFRNSGLESPKKRTVRMNQIQLYCLEDTDDIDFLEDAVVENNLVRYKELRGNIKKSIQNVVAEDMDGVFYSNVDNGALGTLALELDLVLSPYGTSTLVFYRKALKKQSGRKS